MRIRVLTPPRLGGPFFWARSLVDAIRNDATIGDIEHTFQLPQLLLSSLYLDTDIVHATVVLPAKLWRKPTVLTIQGDYAIERNFSRRFYPKAISEAQVITTSSHYIKNKLDRDDVVVIPNCLFPDKIAIASHKEESRLKLVTVMNFHFEEKARGIMDLISMLQEEWRDDYKYLIVGDGASLGMVEEKVYSHDKMDIGVTGFLHQPSMVLANSDIFLYQSYLDNFPNVILEAMATSLPVITNDIGATKEIIENGVDGYVAGSPEEYMYYFEKLAGDASLRKSMGLRARQSVLSKFNWNVLVNDYIEIYKRLMG